VCCVFSGFSNAQDLTSNPERMKGDFFLKKQRIRVKNGLPLSTSKRIVKNTYFFSLDTNNFNVRDAWTWCRREETRVMPYPSESEHWARPMCWSFFDMREYRAFSWKFRALLRKERVLLWQYKAL